MFNETTVVVFVCVVHSFLILGSTGDKGRQMPGFTFKLFLCVVLVSV